MSSFDNASRSPQRQRRLALEGELGRNIFIRSFSCHAGVSRLGLEYYLLHCLAEVGARPRQPPADIADILDNY